MKRFLPVLTLALLLLMLVATPALALPAGYSPVFTPDADGQYTIEHEDNAISANGQYLLLIVKGLWEDWDDYLTSNGGIVISDITYVDQTTSTAGEVSYSGLIPYVQPNSTVFVSGAAYDKPELVGYIGASSLSGGFVLKFNPNGFTVAPTVVLSTEDDVPNQTPSGSATWNFASATYQFTFGTVYEATYDLTVTKPGCLPLTITGIPIDAEFTMDKINIYGGDLNGNNEINTADLSQLLEVLNVDDSIENWSEQVSGGYAYKYADVNEAALASGTYECNTADLSALLSNLGKKGDAVNGVVLTYAEWLNGGY